MRYEPLCRLPEAPDSPQWKEIWDEIVNSPEELGASMFRYWCFNSYWFFLRFCTTFGDLRCLDKANEHYGKPWADHPWVFDRCMELQDDPNDKWFKWPRYYFKSTLITVYYPIWEWVRDIGVEPRLEDPGSDLTILVLTWKYDQTGESWMFHMKREIESNERLKHHWPDLFYPNPKDSGEFKGQSLRIRQRGNPKEASYMISGIDNMPTSGHFRRIICDDCCIRETVRTPDRIKSTYTAMRQTTFLGADDTERRWVGTHWAPGDCYTMAIKDGLFEVDHKDCYDDKGNAVLRSQKWLAQWRKSATDYDWAAQMRGDPVATSQQRFKEEWIQFYDDAHREAKGKNVYIFIDAARTDKDWSDYTTIAVYGLGSDRNYYVLDLYRERLNLEDFTNLLFHLVLLWEPITVWEEQVGAQRDVEHVRYVQKQKGFRFEIKEIPDEKSPKHERISRFQRICCQKRVYFPLGGFGHHPKDDPRDVYAIFFEDEYTKWTPETGALHDDLLDVLSFPLKIRMARRLRFPDTGEIRESVADELHKSGYRRRRHRGVETSPWVI